jgi:hypothetical protein
MRHKRFQKFFTAAFMLLLVQSTWAAVNDKHAVAEQRSLRIGEDAFSVELRYGQSGIYEVVPVGGQQHITSIPWIVCVDGKEVTPEKDAIQLIQAGKIDPKGPVMFKGSNDLFDWTLQYRADIPACVTKTLTLKPRQQMVLNSVSLWNAALESDPLIASTSLLDICAFYRNESSGFFVSLDFPYSKIKKTDELLKVTYPPADELAAGQKYTCHSLTLGRTQRTGIERCGYDDGEVEAMDRYIQTRVKPRFNRPMTATSGINNRYVQLGDGEVFYTMKDNPTLSWYTDWMEKDIILMSEIGLEHYQVWPGPFDAVPGDPDPEYVKKFVKYANSRGVRVGDYSATEQLFCEHYNFYNNNHAQFGITPEECHFGNKKFVDLYITQTTEYCKKYGFEMHCLDFLKIWKRAEGAADEELVYAQGRGLTQVLEAINNVSENMMTWSNSGVWSELLPKIAWYNHNLYLTDPFMDKPWHGLNMTRLLDDVRREQMVSLHYSRFIPYRYLSNVQYFFCQNSIVPDTENYQFGALSTLAFVPNLGFGELRFWLETLPDSRQQGIIKFYRKWLGLINDHYELWTTAYNAGDKPGLGSAEIYGHIRDNHGYVFLVNGNYWDRNVLVPLNERLGFTGNQQCEIKQIYPVEKLCLTNSGPFVQLGQQIPFIVPARQVVVLEIQPPAKKIDVPTVYGIPAVVESTKQGYRVRTSGPQGTTCRFVVRFPEKVDVSKLSAAVCPDIPKQPKRSWKPTALKMVAKDEQSLMFEMTFRRGIAPHQLSAWRAVSGDLQTGLSSGWSNGFETGDSFEFPLFNESAGIHYPLWSWDADKQGFGTLSNFCGGYIENSFSEDQETVIDITTSAEDKTAVPQEMDYGIHVPPLRPLPSIAKDTAKTWWLQHDFQLPFMYGYGCEPAFQEHMFLVLPFLDSSRIKNIQLWINGQQVVVQAYRYPRNRSLGCYYVDLVGSPAHAGSNRVVLHFEQN